MLFGTVAVFIVLAGLGVLMPLILYLAAPVKMVRVLDNVMEWLMVNSNTILMVVLGDLVPSWLVRESTAFSPSLGFLLPIGESIRQLVGEWMGQAITTRIGLGQTPGTLTRVLGG